MALPKLPSDLKLMQTLECGRSGIVKLCVHCRTGEKFACKLVPKSNLETEKHWFSLQQEMRIGFYLSGHPNIVALSGVFQDSDNFYIVMELCNGGDLLSYIVEMGALPEWESRKLFRGVIDAMKYCELNGVVHRDLKPENILLGGVNNREVKLCDFGFSIFYNPGEILTDAMGSPRYVAPEVVKQCYGPKADVWSAGIILYVMLCGKDLMCGDDDGEILSNVCQGTIEFDDNCWSRLSCDARDLIVWMLSLNPAARPTFSEVLQHPWFL